MKKIIKTGLLFFALMFIFSIVSTQISQAGYCEDLCVPKEGMTCTARGITCDNFETYKEIPPIGWPTN